MKLLNYASLEERGVRYSKAHLWWLWTAGNFPRPVKLSASRNVWLESDVNAWVKSHLAERGSAAA